MELPFQYSCFSVDCVLCAEAITDLVKFLLALIYLRLITQIVHRFAAALGRATSSLLLSVPKQSIVSLFNIIAA
jgi:hypothetical protein